jgi:hypothetical protein
VRVADVIWLVFESINHVTRFPHSPSPIDRSLDAELFMREARPIMAAMSDKLALVCTQNPFDPRCQRSAKLSAVQQVNREKV